MVVIAIYYYTVSAFHKNATILSLIIDGRPTLIIKNTRTWATKNLEATLGSFILSVVHFVVAKIVFPIKWPRFFIGSVCV